MATADTLNSASSAQKDVLRAWWKKATISNPKIPNDESVDVDNGTTSINRVFGLPLSESILYAHSTISYIDNTKGNVCYGIIPTIIAKCGSFLKDHGLMVEGIFRMSGSARRIATLQSIFNESEDYGASFTWEGGDYTVHDAANVMRRFLNRLPEPVIPLDYYRPFKDTMSEEFPNLEAKIEAFQNLIECLPLVHQYLLMYIMDFLDLFSSTVEETRMDVSAIAAVFAPGILSHPDDELNPAGYKESQRVLEFLIKHQKGFAAPRSFILPGQNLVPRPKAISNPYTSISSSNKSRPGKPRV
ncbi:Rho GTPase activation protein [Dichotomocladium elegans]|nr:Rho GTPase activation protein [Dichotomocladium elegans]